MRGRLAIVALLFVGATGCFLADDEEFQGRWDGELITGLGVEFYSFQLDFSLIVDDRFTADAVLSATDPASIGPGLGLEGRAFGKVDGNDVSVRIPIELLDGSVADLEIRGERSEMSDTNWPVQVSFLGLSGDATLSRPIGGRWDVDVDDNGENARGLPVDTGHLD